MTVQFIVKTLITVFVVVAVGELAKRENPFATILASLPLTSVLVLTWLHVEGKDSKAVAEMATGIFWMVIPSLVFFVGIAALLKRGAGFWVALPTAAILTSLSYWVFNQAMGPGR